jgi:UDP-N-acetylmuramate--alanine ligase
VTHPFPPSHVLPAAPAGTVGDGVRALEVHGPEAVLSLADFQMQGRRVFMIGIGGSGMSGLARVMQGLGASVSGCDREPSELTASLMEAGVRVILERDVAGLPEGCDLVVASAAVSSEHRLWQDAISKGVRVMLYAQALGACMLGRTGVCIAGTHGKSTTTAMLGCTLTDAKLDPTVIVGATSTQLEGGCLAAPALHATGFRLGAGRVPAGELMGLAGLLVAESCEYNRSFHNYNPRVASIGSVEADHLDVYGTLDAVIESFRTFAMRLPHASAGGRLLIAHEGAHRREVTRGVDARVSTIGFAPDADYVVGFDGQTRGVSISHEGKTLARWFNMLPGAHNAFNAGVAFTLATWLGADPVAAARSLSEFRGIDRRMQWVGERGIGGEGGTVRVFDDYGHHPTEIEVTLRALRESQRPQDRGGRMICVFQPHQHSRTRHLLEEFANSFSEADIVIVPHIYFVRDSEEERQRVTASDLVDRLREKGVRAMHLDPFGAIVAELEVLCQPNDLVVTMGAGPVWQVARDFVRGGVRGAVA